MLRVFQTSGKEILALPFEEFLKMSGKGEQPVHAEDLKRHLQGLCGQPRFRQRLLLPDGQILLDDAALNGPLDVQLILLPFRPSSDEQIRQLTRAASQSDMQALEQLLLRPQDPNLQYGFRTPLFAACATGSVDAVRLLLEACADKDWADAAGATPMYMPCWKGNVEVVRLLLEANADKDKAMQDSKTPIYVASCNGNIEVVRVLLEAKADKDKADASGEIPMSAASKNGHTEVVQLLLHASREIS